ncbi:nitrogenase molybdenum-iron protein alpha chain [Alkalitalea saponilacus]|uniref:Nitrogenase molybdenum-iron protein alpha chain n=1 Tax=Alkalitalea saponilacus TaxID=889453 RepID=A0A1T5GPH0_9BACT|nr:nitrogenase molybdenum-iron protein alpha chain [Alkalitalea saponilacus]ASB51036.1 nitrogenase molybdenum-iron protein alpha chain [Alkalitalea saponilacus]SKC10289.1 nitrogenase molybdenum-iron protein alpha chain [Alkalitalea saponilacus]
MKNKKDLSKFRETVIEKYPNKVAKKRAKGIVNNDPENIPEIQANIRTIPGIITQRGCTYAGCKGVVLGPTRDIVNITHGPIGCGFYSWLTRRNQTTTTSDAEENFITYCFSTDMQDSNIVFGGEEKLKQAVREAVELFNPKAIGIFSTCPVGLIGDDVHKVAEQMMEEYDNKINIFGFSCEGYKGVSQSAGHHIANNQLYKHLIGNDDTVKGSTKYRINMLGEYNIGGDAFEIERIFEKCGIELVATFSGNSTISSFEQAHTADLSLVMCHRSINYVAEMLETSFGIPWIKVNLIGADSTAKALRKIAAYFEDEELIAKVEEVIAEEMKDVEAAREAVLPKTTGKTSMLFVGGSRAHHYQDLFEELGIRTVAAGYEFGHRDDYEGRRVLPSIKIDADSRNIEEITVKRDEKRYKERMTKEKLEEIQKQVDLEYNDYKGLMPQMEKGALVIDDLSHHEMDKLIEMYKPDIFCAGIKEKYVVQKMGVPLKQLHNYDSGGPYAGFKGAINFYNDISMMVSTSIWKEVKAPWEKEEMVQAVYAY